MQLIKTVFLAGLLLTLVSAGIFAAYNRGAFASVALPAIDPMAFFQEQIQPMLPSQVANILPQPSEDQVNADSDSSSSEDTTAQLQTLADRGQEVSDQIGQVLGDFVQVNENNPDQTFQDKAFEYGQYLYCQQVVRMYEEEQKF